MVATLNFGLLQPVDLQSAVAAFDQGRTRRMQRDQMAAEQQMMQQRLDMQQRGFDQEALGNEAVASFFERMGGGGMAAPEMAVMPATAPMQAAPAVAPMQAPAAPETADMAAAPTEEPMQTVTAQRPDAPSPMRFLADMARNGQGQLAMQLWEKSRTMQREERAQVVSSYDAIAAAAQGLAGLPYDQRRAALVNMAPALVARGVPVQMIEGFDPTDDAIMAARNQALGIKGVLEQEDRQADNARADAQLGVSQRQADIAAGNLGLRQAEFGQRDRLATGGVSRDTRRTEGDLRREFNGLPEVKEWRDVSTSFRQIQAAAQKGTAQDDLTLIFSFMKMLDPGSVVREGEFANAQNAAGIPDRIRNLYNRARDGNRLNPTQRTEMVNSAQRVLESRRPRFDAIAAQYRSYAEDYGGDPDRVVAAERAGNAISAGDTRKSADGGTWRFKGGDPARRTNWERVR